MVILTFLWTLVLLFSGFPSVGPFPGFGRAELSRQMRLVSGMADEIRGGDVNRIDLFYRGNLYTFAQNEFYHVRDTLNPIYSGTVENMNRHDVEVSDESTVARLYFFHDETELFRATVVTVNEPITVGNVKFTFYTVEGPAVVVLEGTNMLGNMEDSFVHFRNLTAYATNN